MTHKGDRQTAQLVCALLLEDPNWTPLQVNSILFNEQNFSVDELKSMADRVQVKEDADIILAHPNITFDVKVKLLKFINQQGLL